MIYRRGSSEFLSEGMLILKQRPRGKQNAPSVKGTTSTACKNWEGRPVCKVPQILNDENSQVTVTNVLIQGSRAGSAKYGAYSEFSALPHGLAPPRELARLVAHPRKLRSTPEKRTCGPHSECRGLGWPVAMASAQHGGRWVGEMVCGTNAHPQRP